MVKSNVVRIKWKGNIDVENGGIFVSTVVASGNGGMIRFYKKYVGKKVVVVLADKIRNDGFGESDGDVFEYTEKF